MTSTIREHLKKFHLKSYRDTVIKERLKYWATYAQRPGCDFASPTASAATGLPREPFTYDGFFDRLERLLVENDLVRNVILVLKVATAHVVQPEQDLLRDLLYDVHWHALALVLPH